MFVRLFWTEWNLNVKKKGRSLKSFIDQKNRDTTLIGSFQTLLIQRLFTKTLAKPLLIQSYKDIMDAFLLTAQLVVVRHIQ